MNERVKILANPRESQEVEAVITLLLKYGLEDYEVESREDWFMPVSIVYHGRLHHGLGEIRALFENLNRR